MGIFDIDAESIDFPDRFNCDLCYERIDIMYIDRKGALDGQMVFRCHPCRMRMKKTTSNSLNDAHVGPTIGMRHPLQPLAFKDFSMQDPNDGHAHVPYNDGSFFFAIMVCMNCSVAVTREPNKSLITTEITIGAVQMKQHPSSAAKVI